MSPGIRVPRYFQANFSREFAAHGQRIFSALWIRFRIEITVRAKLLPPPAEFVREVRSRQVPRGVPFSSTNLQGDRAFIILPLCRRFRVSLAISLRPILSFFFCFFSRSLILLPSVAHARRPRDGEPSLSPDKRPDR